GPGAPGEWPPPRGHEPNRIEGRREPFVPVDGDAAILHHPFALSEKAVDTPVDEHAELRIAKPCARGGALRRDVVRCHLRPNGRARDQEQRNDGRDAPYA